MNEKRPAGHPATEDLELLAGYLAGELGEEPTARVREHLTGCAACRLELRSLARFLGLDHDDQLAADAGWQQARPALDARLRARGLPVPGRSGPISAWAGAGRRPRAAPAARWWMPAAAAAAVVLLLIGIERGGLGPERPVADAAGPARGGETPAFILAPLRPRGDLAAAPDSFVWRAASPCDHYTLEVYTADLRTLFRRELIAQPRLAAPNSLRALLLPDSTYLWSVQGFRKLDPAGSMPETWFRIARQTSPR